MKYTLIAAPLALAVVASTVQAQTVTHYWDFEAMADVVGGVPTTAIGTPDLSLHATYGEAYSGSNQSLNTVLTGLSAGGGYLEGDVHDGTNPTDLIFGTADFSFSYWAFDDTTDGDGRGARIFDCLDGTTIGVQIGTNLTNDYNLRIDDDLGGSTITNLTLVIQMPTDTWVHVAVNVDRANSLVEIFFDGLSQGTVPLSSTAAAAIFPTQDLQIGVINSGGNEAGAQQSGLDDLAFYDGLLSAADIMGLASAVLTPFDFLPGPGTAFCPGDGAYAPCPCGNSNDGSMSGCDWVGSGAMAGAALAATGSDVWLDNDSYLVADNINADFGVFFAAPLTLQGNTLGDGLRCIGAGGGIRMVRLTPQINPGGSTATHAVPLQTLDPLAAPGVTRHYQYWFRAPGSICGSGSNTTNGYTIDWM